MSSRPMQGLYEDSGDNWETFSIGPGDVLQDVPRTSRGHCGDVWEKFSRGPGDVPCLRGLAPDS